MSNAEQPNAKRSLLHVVVPGLCIVSGSLDAISLLAMGDAFASVMTGNIVFIGVAIGTSNASLAAFAGTAILGYMTGVLVGSWVVHRWRRRGEDAVWPRRVTKALAVELLLLVGLAVVWHHVNGDPDTSAARGLLFGAAWLMGGQSAAVRAVGVPVSTTYMTGALTTLLEALVLRRPFTRTESTAVTGLSALAFGAFLGALAIMYVPQFAWAVPASALAVVVGYAVWPGSHR